LSNSRLVDTIRRPGGGTSEADSGRAHAARAWERASNGDGKKLIVQIPDLVRNPARRFPDRTCVREGARALSFREVDARADRLAAGLQGRGVKPGDRVAILAFNELEYLEIQVGVQRAHAILVPLNYRLSVPELVHIMGKCGARVLIYGPGLAEAAQELDVAMLFRLGAEGRGEPYDDLLDEADPGPPDQQGLDPAAPVNILYTSGTTGRPKGAVLTNLGFFARSAALALDIAAPPGSVFLQTLPMFHIEAVVEMLHTHAVTHVLLVPATINVINHHPGIDEERFPHLEMVIYGASPIAPEVLRRALTVFGCGFFQLYGMTETCACSILRPDAHDPELRAGLLASAGTDALTFETLVVDVEDRPCPVGTVGEIVTRGPAVMSGYWDDPEESAAALRGGWMHTGDLGYRSEDGYLYVTDRLKDMIITGGENVYPREIEDVLFAHEAVREAAVIGVPDEEWGERVHAIVVRQPGGTISEDDLIAYCRVHLARYKCPKSVEFAAALPKNATGKILKKELRDVARPSLQSAGT
jgi:acyl-CoA synthetase (AMP-forming)/AMP-acid ligase II